MPEPTYDYATNLFWTMLEAIKAHVKQHGSVIVCDDNPMKLEIGFTAEGGERWFVRLTGAKESFFNDPEGRLTFYRDSMASTANRARIAEMLTDGTAP